MKVSELVRLLEKYDDDAEVFIRTEDGYTHDFKGEYRPEEFDGFETVYEEGINLIMID